MGRINLDYSKINPFVTNEEIVEYVTNNSSIINKVINVDVNKSEVLGWVRAGSEYNEAIVEAIEKKAYEIRNEADIFLLIGVGGSNQGSRAVIEALKEYTTLSGKIDQKPLVLYVGNNLSPVYIGKILEMIKGKSLYINVIIKNFETLEPELTFRVVRKYMESVYGELNASKRIVVTASMDGSTLDNLSRQKRYTLFPFPIDVGGRFSVLTPVGLLPIAVGGGDIRKLLQGAKDIEGAVHLKELLENPAVIYASIRNILYKKGYCIEIMSYFEPCLSYFSKWWIQLFAESEGKDGKGILPTSCSMTEDLHSIGQYIQEGKRILFETFLNVEDAGASLIVPKEKNDIDYFSYLENKDFAAINKIAFKGTEKAHYNGGVPCMTVNIPKIGEYYFGQLFYFFEYACFLSASLLGVNPFDQPGVESYKKNMLKLLSLKEK